MGIRQVVGQNVRKYRLEAGISQEELAARMKVEQGYISRLEGGIRNPTIDTIAQLAEALGVTPSLLFEPNGSKPRRKTRRS
jgi:transcriptional regulator with XRE-family HTH domain